MDEAQLATEGGLAVERVYGAESVRPGLSERLGEPGTLPFTRGNHRGGYRDRIWTFRQYSGFGTAEWSNERYKLLLREGGTGLSVAADLPTQIGYDSDDPDVEEEVGRVGVALDSLADAEILFHDIPLDKISTSWTVNGTAAIMMAFYVAVGRKQGVPRACLRGTMQNDILKEYVARGTWIWPPAPSIRLVADTIEFCAAEMPHYNAVSVAGAHFRDAGATAAQEMAFTLQDAVTYCDEVVAEAGSGSISSHPRFHSSFILTMTSLRKLRSTEPADVAGRASFASVTTLASRARRCSGWESCAVAGRSRLSNHRTTSSGSRIRQWLPFWAGCNPCSRPRGTSRSLFPPRRVRPSRSGPSRSWPTRPASPVRSTL
jgi:methylmalonyl-CoA mutase cobalamin-binding domain/chain